VWQSVSARASQRPTFLRAEQRCHDLIDTSLLRQRTVSRDHGIGKRSALFLPALLSFVTLGNMAFQQEHDIGGKAPTVLLSEALQSGLQLRAKSNAGRL
jgi:hypothetical protein